MEPAEALMVNWPFVSVLVPVLVFFISTVTAGTGELVSSITVPEIVFSCAVEKNGRNKSGNRKLVTGNGIFARI
jgi:hypothetical protein